LADKILSLDEDKVDAWREVSYTL